VSRHHAKISRNGAEVWLSDMHSTNGTHLRNAPVETALLTDGDIIMVGPVLLKFGYLSKAELELTQKMHEGTNRDITSGTLNKVGFSERLTQEIAISTRQKGALSLVMCHIDNFQNVYDSGGLPTGHAVLAQFGQLLLSTCRLEDVIGRYDGENFGIILRSIELPNAANMSERLRKIVEKSTFPINEAIALQITVSIGVVGWSPGETGEALITRAHEAMERALNNRGNRIELA
jgi:diguanylate cyclase